jgi:signal transduction histidine kinase
MEKPKAKSRHSISGRLVEAQEQERRRIGRDLHDDIGQRLGLLVLELEETKKLISLDVRIQNRLDRVRQQVCEILNSVHSLSHNLHSSTLEFLGLAAAARSLCREFVERQKIAVDFSEVEVPRVIPHEIAICLFRVLQEALHNIALHSKAQFVKVKLQASHNEIHLLVRDSGIGFDVEASMHQAGLGLISMKERVHLVEGRLSIRSDSQTGTEISVRVPLPAAPRGKCKRS